MKELPENQVRYLEMLQGIVSRMAFNSFALKGWAVTLAAGILAISATGISKRYVLVALLPVIGFWLLDTYYLMLERQYRALFNFVRTTECQTSFDLNISKIEGKISGEKALGYWFCLWSKTEWTYYLPLGAVVVLLELTHVL